MKVYICYEFDQKHGGGGTSVLENLREYFKKNELYTSNPVIADIILFNSFHAMEDVISLKTQFPDKVFVHRIDGPMGVYNSPTDLRDEYVFLLNKYIADATVFQTEWSKKACEKLSLNTDRQQICTIINAPDSSLFTPVEFKYSNQDKLKIFYSSWSTNVNKGFDTLLWLDDHLDWSKYDFCFAGRSEHHFKNIQVLGNLSKKEIVAELKSSHLFLFASKLDPCSNALAEAIATGIPVLCYNGGGSPELLPKNAHTYSCDSQIPRKLSQIANNYDQFALASSPPQNFEKMTSEYVQFLSTTLENTNQTKKLSVGKKIVLRVKLLTIKVFNKFKILSITHGFMTGKYLVKKTIQSKNRDILND